MDFDDDDEDEVAEPVEFMQSMEQPTLFIGPGTPTRVSNAINAILLFHDKCHSDLVDEEVALYKTALRHYRLYLEGENKYHD